MPCGLFGKLPAKRDFVSLRAPRRFLDLFEPWLQGAVASGRQQLGASWQEHYLRMPLWRFWIGEAHMGCTAAGVLMPSVDAVGRYFPLVAFALAEDGPAFLPPELDPADRWYETIEQLMLGALDAGVEFETLDRALAAVADPPAALAAARPEGFERLGDAGVAIIGPTMPLAAAFAAARAEDHAAQNARAVCFWTAGGEAFPPLVLLDVRLPPPTLFPLLVAGPAVHEASR